MAKRNQGGVFKRKRKRWLDADGRRVKPGTPGAREVAEESAMYYGFVAGRRVPLSTNKKAAQTMLGDLIREAELARVGVSDPFKAHRTRPLVDHLADWEAALVAAGAGEKHIRETQARVRWVLDAGKIVLPADLVPSRVLAALDGLSAGRMAATELDHGKEEYTRAEVAKLLGLGLQAVTDLVRRHNLPTTGQARARRYPRATVEALVARRTRGRASKTVAGYRAAVKEFSRWLVADKRLPDDPLAGLRAGTGKRAKVKRVHHARRAFTPDELERLLAAALASRRVVAGLTGRQRHALYLAAIFTGWRAQELASLRPGAFRLGEVPPTAHLDAEAAKNAQEDDQPLPADVARHLAAFLQGLPSDAPVWPGEWFKKAAAMLRVDLRAAAVPYVVQTPTGERFGDFHSLRHSYIGLLDRAGATLREAMQLARHSDPRLTMARYGRVNKDDLAATVQRLAGILPGAFGASLGTGTRDRDREEVRASETETPVRPVPPETTQPLEMSGVESNREQERLSEASSPSRTRTYNKPVNSRTATARKALENSTSGDIQAQLSALLAQQALEDNDLARVLDAWPNLPAHIKAAILALIGAVG